MKSEYEIIPEKELPFYGVQKFPEIYMPYKGVKEFTDLYHGISSIVSQDRCFILWSLLKSIVLRGLTGDYVEVGVYQGGTAKLMFQAARAMGSQMKMHLHDTFEGMPQTSELDHHVKGNFSDTSLERVMETVRGDQDVLYYKGLAQHSLMNTGKSVVLAHVDVDVYESYQYCLETLHPRMAFKGVIVCDDYGFPSCYGGKIAIDEFCEKTGKYPIVLPTGQALILF